MHDASPEQLRSLLAEVVAGRIVKRSKHELKFGSRDVTMEFLDVLQSFGYRPMLVRDVEVKPGERAPAFFIEDGTAYFGWVFWEKFTRLRLRKLFGSVVRNAKGDWAVQISQKRNSVIHANPALKTEMDIDNPSGF